MLAIKRRELIAQKIKHNEQVTAKELSDQFDVTYETIRRDLIELEEQGEIQRTHGGAFYNSVKDYDVDVSSRLVKELESKQKIAKIARSLVKQNNVIYLDSSTTATEIAKEICDMKITVVTNSLLTTNLLTEFPNIRTITIGGELDLINHCFVSYKNNIASTNYFTQISFVSCRSLCLEHGPMDSNEQLAEIRLAAIKNSRVSYLIADHTKFNEVSLYKISSFDDIDGIITDIKPDEQWIKSQSKLGFKLIYPNQSF